MDAALVLQAAVGAAAVDLEDDLLEAAEIALVGVDDLDVPALALGVAAVHAVEVAGEEGGLVAAGGGADLDDDVLVVVRAFRDEGAAQFGFEFRDLRFVSVSISSRAMATSSASPPSSATARACVEVVLQAAVFADDADDLPEGGVLARDRLEALVVVGELRAGPSARPARGSGFDFF